MSGVGQDRAGRLGARCKVQEEATMAAGGQRLGNYCIVKLHQLIV